MNHGTFQYIALLHHMIYHHITSLLMIHHTSLLVGGIPTPLKNMSSSNGSFFPNGMESHKNHVPNHQPGYYAMIHYDDMGRNGTVQK